MFLIALVRLMLSFFFVDCFVLGCLDWSKLFKLVLVLLGCFFLMFWFCLLLYFLRFRFHLFLRTCLVEFGLFSNCFSIVLFGLFWFRLGYCWFCLVVFGCAGCLDSLCCCYVVFRC